MMSLKIQTRELSIFVNFYFHEILEQLKTNIETNVHVEMFFFFSFVIGGTLEFLLLCVTWHLHGGLYRLSCWLKSVVFEGIFSGMVFLIPQQLSGKVLTQPHLSSYIQPASQPATHSSKPFRNLCVRPFYTESQHIFMNV